MISGFSEESSSQSSPVSAVPRKGIMTVRTLADSLSLSCTREPKSTEFKKSSSHRVRFDKVFIREHVMIVGDNPSCSGGAPVSIGWHSAPEKEMSVDDLEDIRSIQHQERYRCRSTLKMPAYYRHQLLMEEWDITMSEILKAAMEANEIREARMKTARNTLRQQRCKELLQSTSKSVRNIFQRKAHTSSSFSNCWMKDENPMQMQIIPNIEKK